MEFWRKLISWVIFIYLGYLRFLELTQNICKCWNHVICSQVKKNSQGTQNCLLDFFRLLILECARCCNLNTKYFILKFGTKYFCKFLEESSQLNFLNRRSFQDCTQILEIMFVFYYRNSVGKWKSVRFTQTKLSRTFLTFPDKQYF